MVYTVLRFCLLILDALVSGKITLLKFQDNYGNFSGVQIFWSFTVIKVGGGSGRGHVI